jgi:hypothetical protein
MKRFASANKCGNVVQDNISLQYWPGFLAFALDRRDMFALIKQELHHRDSL